MLASSLFYQTCALHQLWRETSIERVRIFLCSSLAAMTPRFAPISAFDTVLGDWCQASCRAPPWSPQRSRVTAEYLMFPSGESTHRLKLHRTSQRSSSSTKGFGKRSLNAAANLSKVVGSCSDQSMVLLHIGRRRTLRATSSCP